MCTELTLEQRIKRLEDIEEIKKLQAKYGHYCDKGWNEKNMYCEEVASLFTEDATWKSDALQISVKGRKEISEMFKEMDDNAEFYMHSFSNPILEISGDTATAKWLMLLGNDTGDKTGLIYASYDNEYARTSEGWRIKSIKLDVANMI